MTISITYLEVVEEEGPTTLPDLEQAEEEGPTTLPDLGEAEEEGPTKLPDLGEAEEEERLLPWWLSNHVAFLLKQAA